MVSQKGNVLWFILIAIALMAALTLTFTRSNKNSTGDASPEQNKIMALEILNYAKEVENAVKQLQARGCSENEISFENPTGTNVNPDTPVDGSCKVYDPAGAGLTWKTPPKGSNDGSAYSFTANLNLVGSINGGRSELYFYTKGLTDEACLAINKEAGHSWTTLPESDKFFRTEFTNDYNDSGPGWLSCGGVCSEIYTACMYDTHASMVTNVFYHVLINR